MKLCLFFIATFLVSWLVFASFWYILQESSTTKFGNETVQCVSNLDDFSAAILFSIETQQTIGYGTRHINSQCWPAVVLVMIQSMFSVLLQSLIGGILFAKLSRPKQRTETLVFSKQAVVALRDGVYCLMCRVGDMRKSHIIQTNVRMFLIRTRYTIEGEVIPWNAQELKLGNHLKSSNNLLFMPIVVEHLINDTSPLWDLVVMKTEKVKDEKVHEVPIGFKKETFEIIVVLEGIVETTGATTQARTSYTSTEIKWNHIFEPLVDCNLKKATIDYSKFDRTIDLQATPIYPTSLSTRSDPFQIVETVNEKNNDLFKKPFSIKHSQNSINRAYEIP